MSPFAMNVCSCIVIIFINNALTLHGGDLAVGAYGTCNKIGFIFIMINMGMNQGMFLNRWLQLRRTQLRPTAYRTEVHHDYSHVHYHPGMGYCSDSAVRVRASVHHRRNLDKDSRTVNTHHHAVVPACGRSDGLHRILPEYWQGKD